MSRRVTRREALASIVAGSVLASGAKSLSATRRPTARTVAPSWDTVVVGAGVFGAWTAWHLRAAGERVLLVDAHAPAHARASSGGESRMTRAAYGADEVYTRMALESLPQWRWLSERSGLPIFHPTGVLFFAAKADAYFTQSLDVHRRLKLPTQMLERADLLKRYPQFDWAGITAGLFEPEFGALMARRAVQTLVREFVARGGEYRTSAIAPPAADVPLRELHTLSGETLAATRYVFACGPWLPKVFPNVLGARIFPTRQPVFFFSGPAGDTRFDLGALPGWADFNDGDIYYGFPNLEGRGFKIAHDKHGPTADPDVGDRIVTPDEIADVRGYMARRFPALARQPLIESRVCQYENSSNGDFLIDRHPTLENVWLVGAGSGHGFKHGPAVGQFASELVRGTRTRTEARFSLATKADVQKRAVH
jgi:sarcosine oxidase